MSKKSQMATLAAGALAAYFFDPDKGRTRRARFKDQAASALRSLKEETSARAKYQRNVVEGWMHEAESAGRPAREFNDDVLVQKVKSEVLGNWTAQGHPSVEAEVSNGTVILSTDLSERAMQEELIQRVRQVEGVQDVSLRDGLSVPGGTQT
ncbi:MAG: BON domain-containing protein [Acidimicrobiia bacterium]